MNEYLIRTGESINGVTQGNRYLIIYDRNNKDNPLIVNDYGESVCLSCFYYARSWEYVIDNNSTLNLLSTKNFVSEGIVEIIEQTKKKYLESKEFFKCCTTVLSNFTQYNFYEIYYDQYKPYFIDDARSVTYLKVFNFNYNWYYLRNNKPLMFDSDRHINSTLEDIIDKTKKHKAKIPQEDYEISNTLDTEVAITASHVHAINALTGIDYATLESNAKEENTMLKIEDITTKIVGTKEEVKTTKINGELVSLLTSGDLIERIEDEQKNMERLKKLPPGSTAIKNSISLTDANIARLIELLDEKEAK